MRSCCQLVLSLCFILSAAHRPCVPRYYPNREVPERHRMNCVCNASYCDSVDPVPAQHVGEFVRYTSDVEGLRLAQTRGAFDKRTTKHGLEMRVDVKKRFQKILGFGTSFTDAAGVNLNSLSPGARDNLLKAYYSPEGIEASMARVPIAGTDFSTHAYTYAEDPSDTHLDRFNLTDEDFQLKIPHIRRALEFSTRPLKFMAAAWTAPKSMKTIDNYSGGYLRQEYYQLWADYHVKFLDLYLEEGISFWGVTTGNEPLTGLLNIYQFNSMNWLAGEQYRWVREHLGPTLRRSQHAQAKIMASDDQRVMVGLWAFALTLDKSAASFVDGFSTHFYSDPYFPATIYDWVHAQFPDKFILSTEASNGANPWEDSLIPGSWDRGVLYFKSILENLEHWSGGWLDWNMALTPLGGPTWSGNTLDAPVIVDADEDTFCKQPMFYALGHFAKFVPEGSTRVGITQQGRDSSGVQSMAFHTVDDHVVVVVLNENSKSVPATITDPNHGQINLELTANSFVTIVYPIYKM